jgi:hypothetical protein
MKKWHCWLFWILGPFRLFLPTEEAAGMDLKLQPAGGGAMELTVAGTPTGWYVIEASSDALNWSLLAQGPATLDSWKYLDYMAGIFTNRFYRATQYEVPANDNFSNRIFLDGDNLIVTGWNFGATPEIAEPAIAPLEAGNNSVWWSWIAPAAGTVSISTVGTFWDTLIAVFTGDDLTNLVPLAQFPWHTRELNFSVKEGVACQIAIAGSDDESGPLNFSLTFQPENSKPNPNLQGASVNLMPFQYPEVEGYSLVFSDDAKQCSLNFAADSGSGPEQTQVAEYQAASFLATVDLKAQSDPAEVHRFEFEFNTKNSGTYVHNVGGRHADSGQFTNFRSRAGQLALQSLEGVKLTGTRVWTSTGTSGQSHHYTFNHGGHFHDSDSPEQATGRYSYQPHDTTASLVLDYTGPADFSGDHHELSLTFTSVNGGTFTSHYAKNDGTQITILGDFVIDED